MLLTSTDRNWEYRAKLAVTDQRFAFDAFASNTISLFGFNHCDFSTDLALPCVHTVFTEDHDERIGYFFDRSGMTTHRECWTTHHKVRSGTDILPACVPTY
jgi:hypothetical protein